QFKPNMTKDEAIDLAKRAVRAASLRDSASGDGVDVLVITKDGTEEFTEEIK
ncbi:MAG: proteasome subunit beta, partial [Nitrosopumilus sp.]